MLEARTSEGVNGTKIEGAGTGPGTGVANKRDLFRKTEIPRVTGRPNFVRTLGGTVHAFVTSSSTAEADLES